PAEQAALHDENVERIFSVASPFFNGVGIKVKHEAQTPEKLIGLIGKFAGIGASLPGFKYVFPFQFSIFRTEDKQFSLEVTGPELNELNQIAGGIQGQLMGRTDLIAPIGYGAVRSSFDEGVPELRVT